MLQGNILLISEEDGLRQKEDLKRIKAYTGECERYVDTVRETQHVEAERLTKVEQMYKQQIYDELQRGMHKYRVMKHPDFDKDHENDVTRYVLMQVGAAMKLLRHQLTRRLLVRNDQLHEKFTADRDILVNSRHYLLSLMFTSSGLLRPSIQSQIEWVILTESATPYVLSRLQNRYQVPNIRKQFITAYNNGRWLAIECRTGQVQEIIPSPRAEII